MHGARAGFNFLSYFFKGKTRQDNVLFGVLYSPMYIDFKWKWGLDGEGGGRVVGVDWPTTSEVQIARVG